MIDRVIDWKRQKCLIVVLYLGEIKAIFWHIFLVCFHNQNLPQNLVCSNCFLVGCSTDWYTLMYYYNVPDRRNGCLCFVKLEIGNYDWGLAKADTGTSQWGQYLEEICVETDDLSEFTSEAH